MAEKRRGEQLPKEGERPVFGKHSLSYADQKTAPALEGSTATPPRRPLPEYLAVRRGWAERKAIVDAIPADDPERGDEQR